MQMIRRHSGTRHKKTPSFNNEIRIEMMLEMCSRLSESMAWHGIVAVCYISHNFNMLPIPTPSRNALANISFCDDVKFIRLFAK